MKKTGISYHKVENIRVGYFFEENLFIDPLKKYPTFREIEI